MYKNSRFSVIITAGGTSSRFGKTNKLLEKINGKEVIKHTVETFLKTPMDEVIICANASIIDVLDEMFEDERVKIIEGGTTRQASVFNGIKIADCDFVLIHDGARPMISVEIIQNTMYRVVEKNAVSVMTKTVDTIKEVDENGKIIKTIDRSKLYNTQTPQAFKYDLIKDVHEKLADESFTDDAGMAEALGYEVYIVEGDYRNIKVTTQSDIALATAYLS